MHRATCLPAGCLGWGWQKEAQELGLRLGTQAREALLVARLVAGIPLEGAHVCAESSPVGLASYLLVSKNSWLQLLCLAPLAIW